MASIIERVWVGFALLLGGVLCAAAVSAHGGPGGGPSCTLRLGAWRMDVALYQPSRRDGEMFCDVLPGSGTTVLLLDFIDAALTSMPLELRIVRADSASADVANGAWDTPAVEAATVAHVPPTRYPEGSVQLRHAFTSDGNYLVLLRSPASNGGEWRAAFRFTVGTRGTRLQQAAIIVGGAALLFALLAWARRRGADEHPSIEDNARMSR